jgi:hypothetical protein
VEETDDRRPAMAKILYLCPYLEFREPMFVIAVVSHELAHTFESLHVQC